MANPGLVDEASENAKEMRRLYSMYHQEYTIMAEYRMLQNENLHGIYVIPSYESSFLWFGVIYVRAGFYEGAVLRFAITLPEDFPNGECPVVTFQSSLYHPAVDANTGVLNLKEVFPQWDKSRHHIWQILKYIQYIFYNANMKAPANLEAALLYKTNKKLFMEKVKECVASCIDRLYEDPPTDDKHYITFSMYDPAIHDRIKEEMLKPPSPEVNVTGLSWVQPGSMEPFSVDDDST